MVLATVTLSRSSVPVVVAFSVPVLVTEPPLTVSSPPVTSSRSPALLVVATPVSALAPLELTVPKLISRPPLMVAISRSSNAPPST